MASIGDISTGASALRFAANPTPLGALGLAGGLLMGGLFGGGEPRKNMGASIIVGDDGLYKVAQTGTKGVGTGKANQWGDDLVNTLNEIANYTGGKWANDFLVETNLGRTGTGTYFNWGNPKTRAKLSGFADDTNSLILHLLKNDYLTGYDQAKYDETLSKYNNLTPQSIVRGWRNNMMAQQLRGQDNPGAASQTTPRPFNPSNGLPWANGRPVSQFNPAMPGNGLPWANGKPVSSLSPSAPQPNLPWANGRPVSQFNMAPGRTPQSRQSLVQALRTYQPGGPG